MSHILFLGYGNPLRQDDGFGWHLAEHLEDWLCGCDVEIIRVHQLVPELAEPISRARYVIFADASVEPQPGELELRKIKPDPCAVNEVSHHLSPQALLQMASSLYGHCPHDAFLVTARAHALNYGQELAPQTSRTLDRAITRVTELCKFLEPEVFVTA